MQRKDGTGRAALFVAALALAIAVGAMAVAWICGVTPMDPGTYGAHSEDAALRQMEARVEALEERLLSLPLARGGNEERAVKTEPFQPADRAAPKPHAAGDSSPAPRDARWALARWVESFSAGGEGAEYYRLIVDAEAPLLLEDLLLLIRNRSHPSALRTAALAMVGTPRFRGRADVTDTLLLILVPGDEAEVHLAALRALARVGDRASAHRLADCILDLSRGGLDTGLAGHETVQLAFEVLVSLASSETNRILAGLFARAADDALKGLILAVLRTDDAAAALNLYREVLRESQPVRLIAAQEVGRFRSEDFRTFVASWIEQETDPQVLEALGAAREKQKSIAAWHALRAIGPPDTANPATDSPNAWAAQDADGGEEWIELTYDPPLRASEVHIFEVLAAGGVTGISGTSADGRTQLLWSGIDPLTRPGVFSATFPTTSFAVRTLRIELDTRRGKGWNEIDAVELVGPDGRAWASGATASSNYGEASSIAALPGKRRMRLGR